MRPRMRIRQDKIRVLRIIGECKAGGTETIALNYYRELDHQGFAMDFLFYGKSASRFQEELERNGDIVINVPEYSKKLWGSIRAVKNAVKAGDYDIVHAQLNALNFFPLFGAWLGGAKIRIAANHSTASLKYECKKSIIKYLLKPTTKIFATDYAACSEHAGKWCFGKRNVRNGKVKIIYNAIDLRKFYFSETVRLCVRKELGWEGQFVLGHIGRFTEQKNHMMLLDIFNEIHRKVSNSILVLIGEGHLEFKIRKQVERLGLTDCVQFHGLCFQIERIMQGMDVFLFPSLYEGLGNVIIEAQAVGLKCVVSREVPHEVALTDLVEFMALEEPAAKWAETAMKYKNGYNRESTYERIKSAGYEITTAVEDLEQYYKNLCNRRCPR